jgi:hypothetical protein
MLCVLCVLLSRAAVTCCAFINSSNCVCVRRITYVCAVLHSIAIDVLCRAKLWYAVMCCTVLSSVVCCAEWCAILNVLCCSNLNHLLDLASFLELCEVAAQVRQPHGGLAGNTQHTDAQTQAYTDTGIHMHTWAQEHTGTYIKTQEHTHKRTHTCTYANENHNKNQHKQSTRITAQEQRNIDGFKKKRQQKAHSTQHTAHSTQHTAHSTKRTGHRTQQTAYSTQHTFSVSGKQLVAATTVCAYVCVCGVCVCACLCVSA